MTSSRTGTIIAGRYRLETVMGHGGQKTSLPKLSVCVSRPGEPIKLTLQIENNVVSNWKMGSIE